MLPRDHPHIQHVLAHHRRNVICYARLDGPGPPTAQRRDGPRTPTIEAIVDAELSPGPRPTSRDHAIDGELVSRLRAGLRWHHGHQALGSERIGRRLGDALPGGPNPLRAAVLGVPPTKCSAHASRRSIATRSCSTNRARSAISSPRTDQSRPSRTSISATAYRAAARRPLRLSSLPPVPAPTVRDRTGSRLILNAPFWNLLTFPWVVSPR